MDNSLQRWYTIVTQAMEENMPKTKTKIEQPAVQNTTIKNIQWYLKNLRDEAAGNTGHSSF